MEDVDLPLGTVEKLWAATGGLDDSATEELACLLEQLSLLRDLDLRRRTLRLHDVARHHLLSLYERENLPAHLDFLPAAFRQHGLPLTLYVDYHCFFFTSQPEALTQLGSALRFCEVSLRYAPTPQAKGKIERSHDFWQKRLPPLFSAEQITTLPEANALLEKLRHHHNAKEIHRELRSTPQAAWNLALKENRSVLRPSPNCPWWPYLWSLRSQAKVGSDQRIAVGSQRFHLERPCGSSVTRCIHPNGDASVLLLPPSHGKLPTLLLNLSHPK
jgi:hypothetical protein